MCFSFLLLNFLGLHAFYFKGTAIDSASNSLAFNLVWMVSAITNSFATNWSLESLSVISLYFVAPKIVTGLVLHIVFSQLTSWRWFNHLCFSNFHMLKNLCLKTWKSAFEIYIAIISSMQHQSGSNLCSKLSQN